MPTPFTYKPMSVSEFSAGMQLGFIAFIGAVIYFSLASVYSYIFNWQEIDWPYRYAFAYYKLFFISPGLYLESLGGKGMLYFWLFLIGPIFYTVIFGVIASYTGSKRWVWIFLLGPLLAEFFTQYLAISVIGAEELLSGVIFQDGSSFWGAMLFGFDLLKEEVNPIAKYLAIYYGVALSIVGIIPLLALEALGQVIPIYMYGDMRLTSIEGVDVSLIEEQGFVTHMVGALYLVFPTIYCMIIYYLMRFWSRKHSGSFGILVSFITLPVLLAILSAILWGVWSFLQGVFLNI